MVGVLARCWLCFPFLKLSLRLKYLCLYPPLHLSFDYPQSYFYVPLPLWT